MSHSSSELSLMLIDDHPMLLDGLKMYLHNLGELRVTATANTAKDAKRILQAQRDIDVIILDLNLGGDTDIVELINSLFQIRADVKIVAYTSYDVPSLVTSILKSGVQGYIIKTSDNNELVDAVRKVSQGFVFLGNTVRQRGEREIPEDFKDDFLKKSTLSSREIEVLRLIAKGYTNKEISEQLFISIFTAETHRKNIKKKLSVTSTADLAKVAMKYHLV